MKRLIEEFEKLTEGFTTEEYKLFTKNLVELLKQEGYLAKTETHIQ